MDMYYKIEEEEGVLLVLNAIKNVKLALLMKINVPHVLLDINF
jgi:hypothetical protein